MASLAVLGGGAASCGSSPNEPTGSGGSVASGTGGANTGGSPGASGGDRPPTGGNGTGGGSASGGALATGGTVHGTGGTGGAPSGGTGGQGATGGANNGGSSGSTGGTGVTSGLPWLSVNGNKLQDPTGKTVILRGSALIDIGALYAYGGMSPAGVMTRMDKIAAAGVQGHVVRLPVYPKIDYNPGGGGATCSPCSYPVGTGPTASCTPKSPLSAAEYVDKVLKPAVDYATSKNMYVIIDYHQIDNATSGTSAADAKTFWADIAPKFAGASNVLYEPFNEPIDFNVTWSALKPVVQQLIDTIRAGAPKNIIIVPSNAWDQHPGDAASDPPKGTNLMYTAHIYASNWNSAFQSQVATATAKVPVFISEWGYASSDPSSFGTSLQTTVNGDGASWTAWVTDNGWTPSMFADSSLTALTNFGMLTKSWLAAKVNSDWVQ